jgi:glycogen debranching enzyme
VADSEGRQPFLHDRVICVAAPNQALSGRDGQMRDGGADGFYRGDRRLLSRLVVKVDGGEPEPVSGALTGVGTARFVALARPAGVRLPDDAVMVERLRDASSRTERITLCNLGRQRVRLALDVSAACDLADVYQVKLGVPARTLVPDSDGTGLVWIRQLDAQTLRAELRAQPAPERTDGEWLSWSPELAPRASWSVELQVTMQADDGMPVRGTRGSLPWSRLALVGELRLTEWLRQSLDDVTGLALADPEQPDDVFLGAGSPWFLTLFGRDSLWAARLLLPLGTGLAAGTLRALARRQGIRVNPDTDEAPGKILHELRHPGGDLPPCSYSTVDATPLFVCLLSDAWRWGLREADVAALLPAAESALAWLRDAGARGDGFVRYHRVRPGGLSNQGWKDSFNAVQYADGRLASAPVALCEVQGYAYQAALAGAALLDAFGRPGGERWRDWAAALRDRFRRAFWVRDDAGPYVAMALDGAGRPVDAVASNMGHLLGTGILDGDEASHVARRLGSAELDCGWGLRTLSAESPNFNPLGYHAGTVWTHDTAIAAVGLAATGHHRGAASLIEGLAAAAAHFDYRMLELHGGERRTPGRVPLPYPAACRPQAWAAAAVVGVLEAMLGLRPDVPAGRLTLAPMRPAPLGPLEVRGLRVGDGVLAVRVAADGTATVLAAPHGLTTEVR